MAISGQKGGLASGGKKKRILALQRRPFRLFSWTIAPSRKGGGGKKKNSRSHNNYGKRERKFNNAMAVGKEPSSLGQGAGPFNQGGGGGGMTVRQQEKREGVSPEMKKDN